MKIAHSPIKRVAAIHDLSCFGKTSLSVVVPVISAMGIQVCSVPTAVLSTHTGGYTDFRFVDLTEHLEGFFQHWADLGIAFDCIYTGFLGSPEQMEMIGEFIRSQRQYEPFIVIDPVLGDNGTLYQTMSPVMVEKMRSFISHADIITPNYTEAALLLEKEYRPEMPDRDMKTWLSALSDMGPRISIITSVPAESRRHTYVLAYDRDNQRYWKIKCDYIPTHFPGTGDCFTSVLLGGMLQGDSLPIALDRAVQFITQAIRASYGYDYPEREGLMLERVLGNLQAPVIVSSYEILE